MQPLKIPEDHYVALLSDGKNGIAESWKADRRRVLSRRAARLAVIVTSLIVFTVLTSTYLFLSQGDLSSANLSLQKLTGSLRMGDQTEQKAIEASRRDQLQADFVQFMEEHGKVYASPAERAYRYEIFQSNLHSIAQHNSHNHTYSLKCNAFADLTFDEMATHHYKGYRPRRKGLLSTPKIDYSLSAAAYNGTPPVLPENVDWRDRGCVTEIKDQKKCGSCWAFSVSGAIEGSYCAKHGKVIDLSEQQMIDCSGPEGNEGCNGGEMNDAFEYVVKEGLCLEQDYPYRAKLGACRDSRCNKVVKLLGFADLPSRDEFAVRNALVQFGPVSAGIEADQLAFQFYHKGVFDSKCGRRLDHAILIVGYGTDEVSGKPYWLVKNSWGPKWGDNGFIRISRIAGGPAGECGVLLEPSFPITD